MIAPLPWLWETLVIAVAGTALGLSLSPVEAFAVLTAFNLAMVVPSPGSLGSFESGGTLALVQLGLALAAARALLDRDGKSAGRALALSIPAPGILHGTNIGFRGHPRFPPAENRRAAARKWKAEKSDTGV